MASSRFNSPLRLRLFAMHCFAASLIAGGACDRAGQAQSLELTRDTEPPVLAAPSLAATVVGVLETEAAHLNDQAGETQTAMLRTALQARANVRLLAAELLAAGDRTGAVGSGEFIRGMKIAVNRESLDRMIDQAMTADDGVQIRRGAAEAIESFNRGYADHILRGGDANAADGRQASSEWLAPLLSRLLPAAVEDPSTPLESHWATAFGSTGIGAANAPAPADQAALLNALAQRAADSSLDEEARGRLASIIEFLDRGRQFPELAARVEEHRRVIAGLLDSAEAISAATWLREEQIAALMSRATAAIEAFLDPDRRDEAIDGARRLAGFRRVLAAATALERDNIDAKVLREVIAALETAAGEADDASAAARPLTLAAMTLERMVQVRAITSDRTTTLTRELRIIERDLLKDYRNVETRLLAELAAGTVYSGSLADPNLASLLSDHRERVEDLQRLRRLPEWSAAINRIHPPAAKDFDIQMRNRAGQLLVPTKRTEARLALDRFESELAMFDRMPFEQSLRDNSPAAGRLTGGLQAELLTTLTARRRAWADDWSRAEQTVEPGQAMTSLHRLFAALRDASALIEIRADVLNRWPAWQVSEAAIEAGQSDVETRLRLACAAARGDQIDLPSLGEQVNRIDAESPIARLAGRLMSMLGNQLRECDAGAKGALAQLIIKPGDDAMLLKHRDELARLCRYVAEGAHARESGNARIADECDAYVNTIARRLLEGIKQP